MPRYDLGVTTKTLRTVFILLVSFLVAVVLVLMFAPAEEAHAGVGSSFNLNCAFTRQLPDDPIVYPGQPGASHLHDFFGNRTITADSSSPLPNSTSCQNAKDPSGYWAPSAYINGVRVVPKNIKAYYVHQINGTIIPFPTDLKIIGGSGASTAAQPTTRVYYGCGSGTGISKRSDVNFVCSSGNLQIHVLFPDCGLPGDAGMIPSGVAYSSGHVCDSAHTQHYPQLQVRLNYDVKDPHGLEFSCISSQPACDTSTGRAPFYTVHADFWNDWDQTELARLVGTI